MSEQQSDTILQRLEWLEQEVRRCRRESRWWRVVGSGAVVALVAVLLVGATGSKVTEEIRAKKFVVVDGEGKIRAVWGHGVSDWGPSQEDPTYTGLIFYGKEADSRVKSGHVMLGISDYGRVVEPHLALSQNGGYARLGVRAGFTDFGVDVTSNLSLSSIDRDKNTEIGVTISSALPGVSSGGTYLAFYKQPFPFLKAPEGVLGTSRLLLEMDADGSSRLKLQDKDGQKEDVSQVLMCYSL